MMSEAKHLSSEKERLFAHLGLNLSRQAVLQNDPDTHQGGKEFFSLSV